MEEEISTKGANEKYGLMLDQWNGLSDGLRPPVKMSTVRVGCFVFCPQYDLNLMKEAWVENPKVFFAPSWVVKSRDFSNKFYFKDIVIYFSIKQSE